MDWRKVAAAVALLAVVAAVAAAAEASRAPAAPHPRPATSTAADAPRSGGHWGIWIFGFGR